MFKVLEVMWLIIGLISMAMGIYYTFTTGIGESWVFFVISFFSGVFYSLRRKQRINHEKREKHEF